MLKHGFNGRVYPVTPTHTEVEGLKAYKTVSELPEVPDVALVITPAKTVPDLIDRIPELMRVPLRPAADQARDLLSELTMLDSGLQS